MRRCVHEIYWPADQPYAFGCQTCNPEANKQDDRALKMPRRNSAIAINQTFPVCPECSTPLVGYKGTGKEMSCLICEKDFDVETRNPSGRANRKQANGACPACGSGAHYDEGKIWRCADCNETFPAVRRLSDEA